MRLAKLASVEGVTSGVAGGAGLKSAAVSPFASGMASIEMGDDFQGVRGGEEVIGQANAVGPRSGPETSTKGTKAGEMLPGNRSPPKPLRMEKAVVVGRCRSSPFWLSKLMTTSPSAASHRPIAGNQSHWYWSRRSAARSCGTGAAW